MFWQLTGVWQALGLRASSKTRDRALLLNLLFKRDGLWGEVRGPWKKAVFSRFGLPCWGQKKTWNSETTERRWTNNDRPNMHVVYSMEFHELASYPRKVVNRNNTSRFSIWTYWFLLFVVYHLRHGRKKKQSRAKAHNKITRVAPNLMFLLPEAMSQKSVSKIYGAQSWRFSCWFWAHNDSGENYLFDVWKHREKEMSEAQC